MNRPPNVLWITTDHQRTDALGCYGSAWAHSPNIDALAAHGVRFRQCTCAAPQCTPSRAAIWFARRPGDIGPYAYNRGERPQGLIPLIRPFREAGYKITHFGKYDFPDLAAEFDVDDGCGAEVLDPWCSGVKDEGFLRLPGTGLVWAGVNPKACEETLSGAIALRAQRFLEDKAGEGPFVLRVSINVPHAPNVPLPEYHGATDRDRIDLSIPTVEELASKPRREALRIRRFYEFEHFTPEELTRIRGCFYDLCAELDAAIGRMLKSLEDTGLAENTIVVLHADHGCMLGEHGVGTIRTFYDPVIQVPFVWSWPGRLPEGAAVDDPVELFALLPTLLDLAGLDVPDSIDHDAESLVGLMRAEESRLGRATFAEHDTALAPFAGADWIPREVWWQPEHDRRIMVRKDGWKLECNYGPSEYGQDAALYDLRTDPGELVNRIGDPRHDAEARELQAVVREKFSV